MERLLAEHLSLEALAEEHAAALERSKEGLEDALQSGDGALEAIEAWRQLVGLEELQGAASRMSGHLEAGSSPGIDAARAQCREMCDRLAVQRAEEEESQRLRMRRRYRRSPASPTPCATLMEAGTELPQACAALLEARQRLALAAAADPRDHSSQQLLSEARLRLVASQASGSAEEPPDVALHTPPGVQQWHPHTELRWTLANSPEGFGPMSQAELEKALDAVEERAEWLGHASTDLLHELDAVFHAWDSRAGACRSDATLEDNVLDAMDRWRKRQEALWSLGAAGLEGRGQAGRLLQDLAREVEALAAGVQGVSSGDGCPAPARAAGSFAKRGAALLDTWSRRSLLAAEGARPAEAEDGERAHWGQRRQRQACGHRRHRWCAPAEPPKADESEVRAARFAGEAVARLLFRHVDQDAEEQARKCLDKVAQRRERLGLAKPERPRRHSHGGSRLVGRDLGEDLAKTWVWSRSCSSTGVMLPGSLGD